MSLFFSWDFHEPATRAGSTVKIIKKAFQSVLLTDFCLTGIVLLRQQPIEPYTFFVRYLSSVQGSHIILDPKPVCYKNGFENIRTLHPE